MYIIIYSIPTIKIVVNFKDYITVKVNIWLVKSEWKQFYLANI